MARPVKSIVERFWAMVKVVGEGCWEWQGSLFPTGYGQFGVAGKNWRAHRFAWVLAYGPIPEGKNILHSCDNRKCCRLDHLRAGTQSENLQEAHDKGRMVDNRGPNGGRAKLNCEQVAEIRRRYKPRDRKNGSRALGKEFGVAHVKILDVAAGKSYTNC